MTRARKIRWIIYAVYLLIVLGAAFLLYQLIPSDVLQAIRDTYVSGEVGDL